MAKQELRVALIGYGFMGRTHANAYRMVGNFFDSELQPVLKLACGRSLERVRSFADRWGFEGVATDWREAVERDDVDLVDICTPNDSHREIALAAAAAGKAILCEKPLALNLAEAEEMVQAVEAAGVPNLVSFNYRRVPAVALAKRLIDDGRLGKVFHYRAQFLQDWAISPDVPQGGARAWRLDVGVAGSGVTGDLLSHCIDSAQWHNGPITRVSAMTETFVKQRMHLVSGQVEPVGIDDACVFHCRFENGSLGSFESTRFARGHKALYTFEINGERASLAWNLHDLHRLSWFDHADEGRVRGWRSVHVTDHGGDQPYMDRWWVPGLQIGYAESFVHQLADFLYAMSRGEAVQPDFRSALQTQRVCAAVLESGAAGRWVDVATC